MHHAGLDLAVRRASAPRRRRLSTGASWRFDRWVVPPETRTGRPPGNPALAAPFETQKGNRTMQITHVKSFRSSLISCPTGAVMRSGRTRCWSSCARHQDAAAPGLKRLQPLLTASGTGDAPAVAAPPLSRTQPAQHRIRPGRSFGAADRSTPSALCAFDAAPPRSAGLANAGCRCIAAGRLPLPHPHLSPWALRRSTRRWAAWRSAAGFASQIEGRPDPEEERALVNGTRVARLTLRLDADQAGARECWQWCTTLAGKIEMLSSRRPRDWSRRASAGASRVPVSPARRAGPRIREIAAQRAAPA